MFKAENRLKKRKEFNYIYKNGTVVSSNLLVLYFLHTPKRNLKVGFSVSKKVGKAVIRNKVKRRLKAITSEYIPKLIDFNAYVILAKESANTATFNELKQNVNYLLNKAKVLKDISNEKSV